LKTYFINHFKKYVYLFVFAGLTLAHAGSYEDYFRSVESDEAAVVKRLLGRGFDPNTLDPKGQHGLYIALRESSLKVAQLLVDWPKTDVNKLNAKDESPLMLAALKGHQKIAEALVKRGADVNKTGWAPLHYAASSGSLPIIAMLIENSAYIDAESPNGTTPLMMAAMYGTPEAVKLLIDEGADVQLKNAQGLTALQFARRAERANSVELIVTALKRKQPQGNW
jgi:uncharacterized protein